MKTGLRATTPWHEMLGVRVAFLLGLALLPIGVLAGVLTWQMLRQSDEVARIALLGRTAEAAAAQRTQIQSALGAGDALVPAILDSIDDPARCNAILREFIDNSSAHIFAGFITPDGTLRCSSRDWGRNLHDEPGFTETDSKGTLVIRRDKGAVTGRAVVIVSKPVLSGGRMVGRLAISMPIEHDYGPTGALSGSYSTADRRYSVITYSATGELLTATTDQSSTLSGAQARELLPDKVPITELTGGSLRTFYARTRGGESRLFTVVPIVPGLVFALGSFRLEQDLGLADLRSYVTMLVPALMWLASIMVAYVTVDRLVIRHVRQMRGQMRRFALGDRGAPPEVLKGAAAEIQDVSQTFHNLARILIRDEQQLEASVEEKTVLLKEIHHRVKNNLQLISSIMNMQIRHVAEPSAKSVLRSVQERVMSLATVHRRLYQTEALTAVRADDLLGDIVHQLERMAGDAPGSPILSQEIAPLVLMPDDAVPLALLTTEAVTNAIKYARPLQPGRRAEIAVRLAEAPEGALLEIRNTIGFDPLPEPARTGLGEQLMAAFSTQLGSRIEKVLKDGWLTVRMQMPLRSA